MSTPELWSRVPSIAICQPIRAAGRSATDVTRHRVSLRSLEHAVRHAACHANFTFVTVLSGVDDGSGAQMALACLAVAEGLQVPHILLSSPLPGKPLAVNTALDYVWHRADVAFMLDDDIVLPRSAFTAILEKKRRHPTADYICFLKTALGPRYYSDGRWTGHLEATYLSFLPSVIETLVRLHPEHFSFVPTGSAYARACRGPLVQLATQCNEADVIVAADYALTGLSVGSWFGSDRSHEVQRRQRQITDSIPSASNIKPVKATRFLRIPSNLEASLDTVYGFATGRKLAEAIRHTSSIMEDTYDHRADIAAI